MKVSARSSRPTIIDIEGGSDVALNIDVPLRVMATTDATIMEIVLTVDGTKVDDGGTRFEGSCDDEEV